METAPFGITPGGEPVRLFTIRNKGGLELQLSEYGATVVSLQVPDRDGEPANVTLGKPDFDSWLENPDYLGATVGRFGNRIAGGKFSLNGKDYELAANEEQNHLHGGVVGFDQKVWQGQPVIRPKASGVCFTLFSDAGDESYPGNLTCKVTYWLTEDNELVFEVNATTDAPTPVNIINHTYWNLSGDFGKYILGHDLQLLADEFLPTNAALIPTGERAPVRGTPMDFNRSQKIGERLLEDFEPLKLAGGYDHCWIVREHNGDDLRKVAVAHDPDTGRVMEVFTDQPGVQFYIGNFLPNPRTAFCLETQCFPDSPNQRDFPNCILNPGETYKHTCVFRFSAR